MWTKLILDVRTYRARKKKRKPHRKWVNEFHEYTRGLRLRVAKERLARENVQKVYTNESVGEVRVAVKSRCTVYRK